ncbi:hypothetical protein [Nocardioides campestrisoli]|uniref:hypothetical protein n=1 Tax=Nocardioides campestrisoli TaxID=2736757 RepID=UPI00163DBD50|nr:hypothetical protein [Nocardioides campestrisoli]
MTETPHTWRDIANGRFDVEPKPLPSYEAPQEDELPGPAPEAPAPAPADAGRRRTWPIVVTVALLAGAAGFAGGATLDPLDRGSDREARAAELRGLEDDLDAREASLTEDQADLAKARKKVTRQRKALTRQEKAVATREKAVAEAEQELTDGGTGTDVVDTDGVFEVGVDVEAGTYEAVAASGDCTWVQTDDEDSAVPPGDEQTAAEGETITITLTDGGFFRTTGCGEWVAQF